VFIAWQNHFHITAPLVFVCLGFMAVVATVYNLWRTGAAAVASSEDDGDSTWAKPAGVLGELEREKRTLLKAIKEAEFDHQMGKLSKRDVDDMIRTYRARAIEVFKEIERLELGTAGSAREQIMREVRARIELEARSHKKPAAEPKQAATPGGRDARGKKKLPLAREGAATPEVVPGERDEAAARAAEAVPEAPDAAGTATAAPDDAALEAADAAAATAAPEVADAAPARTAARTAARTTIDDEVMDADSTTAMEPKREDPRKEATP